MSLSDTQCPESGFSRGREDKLLSIVIPAHNESGNITFIYQRLTEVLRRVPNIKAELILVDDGSTDNTWEEMTSLEPVEPFVRVKCVRFSRNFGKEAAIYAGLSESEGDAAVVMDADGQHPPELIPDMIKLWLEGAHVVDAVKKQRQKEPILKRIGAEAFYWIFKKFTGLNLRNKTDFKLLSKRATEEYIKLPERKRFFRGLVSWISFPSSEVFFIPEERTTGKSSWNYLKLLSLSWNSIISFSVWPLRVILLMGFVGIFFSILMTIHTLYNKITGHSFVGFPTVIILINFFSSLILIALGIIGEYISQIYEEVKKRPIFIITETIIKQISF